MLRLYVSARKAYKRVDEITTRVLKLEKIQRNAIIEVENDRLEALSKKSSFFHHFSALPKPSPKPPSSTSISKRYTDPIAYIQSIEQGSSPLDREALHIIVSWTQRRYDYLSTEAIGRCISFCLDHSTLINSKLKFTPKVASEEASHSELPSTLKAITNSEHSLNHLVKKYVGGFRGCELSPETALNLFKHQKKISCLNIFEGYLKSWLIPVTSENYEMAKLFQEISRSPEIQEEIFEFLKSRIPQTSKNIFHY